MLLDAFHKGLAMIESIEFIKHKYESLEKDFEQDRERYLRYCRDPNISLDERFDAFMSMPDVLKKTCPHVIHFDDFESKYGELHYYNDFFIEKNQTVDVIFDLYNDLNDDFHKSNALLENIFKLGYHSFVNCW